MKHLKKIFVFLSAIISLSAYSKDENHALLANIGTFAIGNYELSYEHKLDKSLSLSTLAYYYESREGKVLVRVFSHGYSLGVGFAPKFHVWGEALKNSFYLAPAVKIGYLEHVPRANKDEVGDKSIMLRVGGVFGYAHKFSSGFMIDTNVGLDLYHGFSLTKEPTYHQKERPVMIRPTFALSLGYAF